MKHTHVRPDWWIDTFTIATIGTFRIHVRGVNRNDDRAFDWYISSTVRGQRYAFRLRPIA
jgi:hypothetical protein